MKMKRRAFAKFRIFWLTLCVAAILLWMRSIARPGEFVGYQFTGTAGTDRVTRQWGVWSSAGVVGIGAWEFVAEGAKGQAAKPFPGGNGLVWRNAPSPFAVQFWLARAVEMERLKPRPGSMKWGIVNEETAYPGHRGYVRGMSVPWCLILIAALLVTAAAHFGPDLAWRKRALTQVPRRWRWMTAYAVASYLYMAIAMAFMGESVFSPVVLSAPLSFLLLALFSPFALAEGSLLTCSWVPIFGLMFFLCARSLHLLDYADQRRQRRIELGLCGECGYDLCASKDRCPECGTPFVDSHSRPVLSNAALDRGTRDEP
jgi:hypothetical protein